MSESPTDTEHQDNEKVVADLPEAIDGNAEAAKWRRRLREAEAERDTLAAQVEQIQRSQIDALLERENVTLDGLTALGATLTDLLDTAGRVDPDKVSAAAEHARATLGIPLHAGLLVPAEGRIPRAPTSGSFSAAFAPKEIR